MKDALLPHRNDTDELEADEHTVPVFEWDKPHPNLEFSVDFQIVRYAGREVRVKEQTVLALRELSRNLRHQADSKVLPTKEDLYCACGYSERDRKKLDNGNDPRKLREFKIGKDLFPYAELKDLVRFDRRRKGYYLCLS